MKRLILILIFLGFGAAGKQLEYTDLRFISVDEAPANYLNESGELSGFVTEIIKRLQLQLKIDTDIEVMPEARAIKTLDSHSNVIMFSISRSVDRESKYHWLAHVVSKRWVLFSKFESPYYVTSVDQVIRNKSIGVIRGDIREKWLQDKHAVNLVSVVDYSSAVEMLMRDRFEFLFFESFGVYSILQKLGFRSDAVRSQLIASESDVYIVMSKLESNSILAKELQNQLALIKSSDWYQSHLDIWVKKLNELGVADAWVSNGVLKY